MRRIEMIIALGTLVVATTGCRDKLRVTKWPSNHEIGHYAADGGVVLMKDGKACVAPPAQAATTIKIEANNAVKAAVTKAVTAEIATNNKLEESLHSLYEQGQATLFLQFMAYRLCEANLNGEIDNKTYLTELEKINARGETLLKHELDLARERSKKADSDARKADSETKAKLKAAEVAVDPTLDAATKVEALRQLAPE